jgi:hypothetical protein
VTTACTPSPHRRRRSSDYHYLWRFWRDLPARRPDQPSTTAPGTAGSWWSASKASPRPAQWQRAYARDPRLRAADHRARHLPVAKFWIHIGASGAAGAVPGSRGHALQDGTRSPTRTTATGRSGTTTCRLSTRWSCAPRRSRRALAHHLRQRQAATPASRWSARSSKRWTGRSADRSAAVGQQRQRQSRPRPGSPRTPCPPWNRAGRRGRSACSSVSQVSTPKPTGTPGVDRHLSPPVGRLADVGRSGGGAADHHPERDHSVVARRAATRHATGSSNEPGTRSISVSSATPCRRRGRAGSRRAARHDRPRAIGRPRRPPRRPPPPGHLKFRGDSGSPRVPSSVRRDEGRSWPIRSRLVRR